MAHLHPHDKQKTLRIILGDQLSGSISSLRTLNAGEDVVLMMEVADETRYVRHHKHTLGLVLAAMRHFAESLKAQGITVDYVTLTDSDNSGSFSGEVERACRRHVCKRIIVTEPSEWRVRQMMSNWSNLLGIPVDILEDDRFLCPREDFEAWATSRKNLRMEFFYREMRRKTGWLMDGKDPEGGRWNYDAENRKKLPKDVSVPPPKRFIPDEVTREVMFLIQEEFPDHFGNLETFGWAVTRTDAQKALDYFIENCLANFGNYQDAMKAGDDYLFHSVLSPYLNIGLLTPREVCERAIEEYERKLAPLHSVEGFIRQILGWREFVRGLYWLFMPEYSESNYLSAGNKLPKFYWTGQTELLCLREAIQNTHRNAYAHHIQRLMVTGNFALLTGINPKEVEEWYLIVYADAFEWVELPNVHGMVLHADGGLLGSKPYAASGAYINRMSDYCSNCVYDPNKKSGPSACPFNYLYWNFLISNEDRLRKQSDTILLLLWD